MALSIGGPYPRETPGQEPGTQGSRQQRSFYCALSEAIMPSKLQRPPRTHLPTRAGIPLLLLCQEGPPACACSSTAVGHICLDP